MRSCLLAILLCENPIDYAWTGALPAIELVVPSMVPYTSRLRLLGDALTDAMIVKEEAGAELHVLSAAKPSLAC